MRAPARRYPRWYFKLRQERDRRSGPFSVHYVGARHPNGNPLRIRLLIVDKNHDAHRADATGP